MSQYGYTEILEEREKGENTMRKKLLTGIMTAAMVMCLGVTPAFAGNTNYAT